MNTLDIEEQSVCEALMRFSDSDSPAVWCNGREISYRELCREGRHVARQLIRLGVVKGDRVAFSVGRSADAVIAILGILLSGGALVPLSGDLPKKLRDYILRDCAPKLVVDEALLTGLLQKDTEEDAQDAALPALPALQREDLFAVMYTSGSTGSAKGTVLRHGTMVNFCLPVQENLLPGLIAGHAGRCLVDFSFSFLSFYIFSSAVLMEGKCLLVAADEQRLTPKELALCMRAGRADALFHTPSLLTYALAEPLFRDSLKEIRLLGLIGEKLTEQMMDAIRRYLPEDTLLCITYASTEMSLNTCTVLQPVRSHLSGDREGSALPGAKGDFLNDRMDLLEHPCRNVLCQVLNEDGKPVSEGACGELCIGGLPAHLGMYWHDDALNAERYEEHPQYGRIFHTRDLVRREKGGLLRFIRRMDGMIKLHGQRIEPGMIEQAMLAFPGIREAAAVLHQEQDAQVLAAFYTVDTSLDGQDSSARERELFQTLSGTLPYYMIPASLTRLKKMPLNTSGKLDRKALSRLPLQTETFTDPENALEELLCTLYRQVLGTKEKVGARSSFFALGGDSLSAMRLMDALRGHGWRMELRWIFACPSPRLLAACLKREGDSSGVPGDPNAGEALHAHPDPSGENSAPFRMPAWTSAQADAVRHLDAGKEVESLIPLSALAAEKAAAGDPWMFSGFWVFDWTGDLRTLQERFAAMTRAHCALRSIFLFPEGEPPVQAVLREHSPDFFIADRAFEAEEGVLLSERQKRYLGRLLLFEGASEKDLTEQVLVRGGVIRISPGKVLLHLYYSHLLLDNHGLAALLTELPDAGPLQTDMPRMERRIRRLLSSDREKAMAYWQGEGLWGQTLTLFPAPAEESAEHTSLKSFLLGSKELTREIRDFCRREQVTMAALLHCVLGRALCAVTGRDPAAFWSMTDGRAEDELSLPGMFSHRFPFLYHSGETVKDCQERLLRSMEHAWIFRQAELRPDPARREKEITLDMVQTFRKAGADRMEELRTEEAVDRETLSRLSVERYEAEGEEFRGMLMIFSFPAIDRVFLYRAPTGQFDQDALKKLDRALRSELDNLLRSE